MSFGSVLVVSLIAGLAYLQRRMLGDCQLERPIVLGPLVGLLLGDVSTGLQVGASLELVFMGAQAIGGSVPSNVAIASVLGTAVSVTSGTGLEGALVVAIPTAVVATSFELFAKTVCSFLAHGVDKYAEEGNSNGISMVVQLGNLIHFLAYFVPTFLALYFGATFITDMTTAIPGNIMAGIKAVGALLPALGFGMLLSTLSVKKLIPYFFIGFAIAAYVPAFGVMGVAIIGVAYIIIYVNTNKPAVNN
ncbi:MAG: PTS sugar transporter subunit IIC [Oscillospiraceae bacterium]|nr:PTS sugar transporter subunit IIC [Oscillospiraceae bacterium]